MKNKIIAVDLDGTLNKDYQVPDIMNKTHKEISEFLFNSKPNIDMIKKINKLSENNYIYIFTTRSDLYKKITEKWLNIHNVKYNNIIFNKPFYDKLIDDKSENIK